jgi:hypothetical protein
MSEPRPQGPGVRFETAKVNSFFLWEGDWWIKIAPDRAQSTRCITSGPDQETIREFESTERVVVLDM